MSTGQNTTDTGMAANYTLLAGIIMPLFASQYHCKVEIMKPYHPRYVQAGEPMELVCTARNCQTNSRVRLQWDRKTEGSKWKKESILPQLGGRFTTKNLYVEPSGEVDSTLVIYNISVADHGWYVCRDHDDVNTYTIWVTTLVVDATPNITVSETDGIGVTLGCTVSGPPNNLPSIEYEWMFGNLRVINITNRYTLHPPSSGTQRLRIHQPKKKDGGVYKCSFRFKTNLGPVEFSKSIYVDTSQMTSDSWRCMLHGLLLIACLLLTTVNQKL